MGDTSPLLSAQAYSPGDGHSVHGGDTHSIHTRPAAPAPKLYSPFACFAFTVNVRGRARQAAARRNDAAAAHVRARTIARAVPTRAHSTSSAWACSASPRRSTRLAGH